MFHSTYVFSFKHIANDDNMIIIESAGISDIGKKRKSNEDALLVSDELGLYVVADGMGGHRAGEIASRLVVESIHNFIKNMSEIGESSKQGGNEDDSLSFQANRILEGIHRTNRVVYNTSISKENYRGMGSTISLLHFNKNTLIAANVGDSPIYMIHKGKIELLSVPHTVLAEHAAIDPVGASQLGGEFKHMLTRAMGTEETVKADICEVQYFKGDKLVISSDGLTDLVTPEEILEVVDNNHSDKACRSLVNLANARGGSDNITVIVLKIKKDNKSFNLKNLISKLLKRILNGSSKE